MVKGRERGMRKDGVRGGREGWHECIGVGEQEAFLESVEEGERKGGL